MMETIDIVKNFDPDVSRDFVPSIKAKDRIFITGEGSYVLGGCYCVQK
jgi:hypothetical protein